MITSESIRTTGSLGDVWYHRPVGWFFKKIDERIKVVFIIKIVKKVKQAIDFFTISYILYIENFIFRDIVEK